MVGMDADTLPMASVLDVMAEQGKATGIVVTCYSGHATPDGGEKAVNLNLLEQGGVAKLYLGSQTPSFIGTWSEANNKLTLSFEDKTGEFEKVDGKYTVIIRVSISSFFGSSVETIILAQA